MFARMASFAQKTIPVKMPMVAVAVVIGLFAGAFYWGESADLATAVGIVVGFSCAVGNWLGIRLYLAVARLFISWIDVIRKQVAGLEPRLILAERPGNGDGRKNPHRSLVIRFILISVYATPFCFVMVTTGAIGAILSTQLGAIFVTALLTATLSGLAALILVVAIQAGYLWRIHRRVASFRRYLTPVEPDALPAEVLDHNISRTARIVRNLTGIGQAAAEQATA